MTFYRTRKIQDETSDEESVHSLVLGLVEAESFVGDHVLGSEFGCRRRTPLEVLRTGPDDCFIHSLSRGVIHETSETHDPTTHHRLTHYRLVT